MTRPAPMPEHPPHRFTAEQLCAAYDVAEPWREPPHLFWEMATRALLDRDVTDADVAQWRPMIRQAAEER